MYSHWSTPENIIEEFREGEFRNVTLEDRNIAAHFCYKQVFMAALRRFPSLSKHTPLKERERERKREQDDNYNTDTDTDHDKNVVAQWN